MNHQHNQTTLSNTQSKHKLTTESTTVHHLQATNMENPPRKHQQAAKIKQTRQPNQPNQTKHQQTQVTQTKPPKKITNTQISKQLQIKLQSKPNIKRKQNKLSKQHK